jgi:hypothetical protein
MKSATLRVKDALGRVVLNRSIDLLPEIEVVLPIHDLPVGNYSLEVLSASGRSGSMILIAR